MKKIISIASLILTFVLTASITAQTCPGGSGCLDGSFGVNGVSTYTVSGAINLSVSANAVQGDQKIVALADAHGNPGLSFTNVVIRYNADGTLDTSFANQGFLYMNWNGANNAFGNAYGLTLQSVGTDQKILVAGTAGSGSLSLRVDRYNSDGSPDTTFGSNGKSVVSSGYALSVAAQSNGKIVTFGDTGYLTRFNLNGTLDTSFGNGGIVSNSSVSGTGLAFQPDGKILACGTSSVKGKTSAAVARFNLNGSADGTFGTSGKTTLDFYSQGSSGCHDVLLDSSGRIVAGGSAAPKNSGNWDFAAARLTAAGRLDASFSGDGMATIDTGGYPNNALSTAIQSDGRIVLAGLATVGSDYSAAIARFNSNGSVDISFGQNGFVLTDFLDGREFGFRGAMQVDPICACEKIIVTGRASWNGVMNAIVARYLE